ncbi:MAG: chloride channel protein [Thermodesulfobacteriota bacterium]|nr:chloride channel protein [Thermodesulfobacteriota bacterium]
MEAVALKGGIIRKRVVLIKSLASAICIGTGGSAGREGPIVQIGSAIGSSFGQIMKVSADRMRTLVGCGAAAGIAATFNAPIAGVMFAMEIILGEFGIATFSPIVVSSVMATVISRAYLGDYPAFVVPHYTLVNTLEIPFLVYAACSYLCQDTRDLFYYRFRRIRWHFCPVTLYRGHAWRSLRMYGSLLVS